MNWQFLFSHQWVASLFFHFQFFDFWSNKKKGKSPKIHYLIPLLTRKITKSSLCLIPYQDDSQKSYLCVLFNLQCNDLGASTYHTSHVDCIRFLLCSLSFYVLLRIDKTFYHLPIFCLYCHLQTENPYVLLLTFRIIIMKIECNYIRSI